MSKQRKPDTFSVTFELAEGKQVTSQATFTGPEWDRVYRWICRLTPTALDRVAQGQRIERISLSELVSGPALEPGTKAFFDFAQLNEFLEA